MEKKVLYFPSEISQLQGSPGYHLNCVHKDLCLVSIVYSEQEFFVLASDAHAYEGDPGSIILQPPSCTLEEATELFSEGFDIYPVPRVTNLLLGITATGSKPAKAPELTKEKYTPVDKEFEPFTVDMYGVARPIFLARGWAPSSELANKCFGLNNELNWHIEYNEKKGLYILIPSKK